MFERMTGRESSHFNLLQGPIMKAHHFLVVTVLACAFGGLLAAYADDRGIPLRPIRQADPLPVEGQLPSLGNATAWINSPPLTADGLRGKVVLVNFWTYSCINSLRQIPYVRAWAEKYKAQGLVVIGVHAPEFGFEGNLENVRQATKDLRIEYPVAVDNGHAIWTDFRNEYWPALYFIDAQGRIRHRQFGEGDYEKSEVVIKQLLAESGSKDIDDKQVPVDAPGVEASADWVNVKSPETYVGYARAENFASPGGLRFDDRHVYATPARLSLNHWALSGEWKVDKEAALLNGAGSIIYRFHARDLHLVMGAVAPGSRVRFRILIDGQPPGSSHGIDVDSQGNGIVRTQRLYQLIRQTQPVADREFEIEFLDPGAQVFAFTFG
jgi:thiol-disulfide isomerase/thioredoxin